LESLGRDCGVLDPSWESPLVRSRFHRAAALIRLAQEDAAGAEQEARQAAELQEALVVATSDPADELVSRENRRSIIELQLMLEIDPTAESHASSSRDPGE
jgi:hypothetical protein